jgi:multicomponent Na+:H+ antiporter subunit G
MMSYLAYALMIPGTALLLVGALGLLRLPDFYCRTHAATKPDTLGLVLILLGLGIYDGLSMTTVKMLMIILFVFLANPTSSHAMGRAAILGRVVPWTANRKESRR